VLPNARRAADTLTVAATLNRKVRRSITTAELRRPRNSVAIQDLRNFVLSISEDGIELVSKIIIAATHTERDVINEREKWHVDLWRHRDDGQRHFLLWRVVTRQRTPCNGRIDLSLRHCLDELRRRALLPVVAVQRVAADVVDDAALCQSMGGWSICPVVTDQMNADFQLAQNRIVERFDPVPSIGSPDKDVGGPVIRPRGLRQLEARGYAQDDVAGAGAKRVPDESPSLRPPCVFDPRIEVARDQLCDTVLESFQASIAERKIVRICAHSKDPTVGRSVPCHLLGRWEHGLCLRQVRLDPWQHRCGVITQLRIDPLRRLSFVQPERNLMIFHHHACECSVE
jgi:hypothetical protein